MQKKNILNLSLQELEKEVIELNEQKFRAKQIFTSIHKTNIRNINEIFGIPALLKTKLAESLFFPELRTVTVTDSQNFNTKKFLFEIISEQDNYFIEAVLISENGRDTFCISTQVGCNVGCEFCATGRMGFKKNLDVSQIVAQVYEVTRQTKVTPTNIVFMGMGEPFLNYDNMLKSLKILTHPNGLALSSKRITVSTVGFIGKIKKFADDLTLEENKSIKNVKLALSLHSTDNGIRESIIPTSVKNSLSDIYKELVYFYQKTKNKITYEYIFFPGLNDTENDIKRIAKVVRMVPSNLNIIPFHPTGFELKKPLDIFNNKKDTNKLLLNKKLNDFIARLKKEKVIVNLRTSSGVDINAACGQLAVIEDKSHFKFRMYQLIIIGPPGVGKGTQAELIAKNLSLEHISTGAILRQSASEGTELGRKAKELMDKGYLVPDEIMNGIVKETLSRVKKEGFILDGFPRTLEQAKALSEIFNELHFNEVKVVNLKVNENEIIDRLLKRGRSDDTKDTIRNRLKIYNDSTAPVKDYYEKEGLVNEVDGIGDVENINKNILNTIKMSIGIN